MILNILALHMLTALQTFKATILQQLQCFVSQK